MDELGNRVVGVGSSGNAGVGIGVCEGLGVFVGKGVFVGGGNGVEEGTCVGTAVAVFIATGISVWVDEGAVSGVGMTSRVKTTRVASTSSGSVACFGAQLISHTPTKMRKVMRAIVLPSDMKGNERATCEGC